MVVSYREANGDFLAIDTTTRNYYLATLGRDEYEGRAAAIEGVVGSVCTTGISRGYLRACCTPVPEADVPAVWRQAICIGNLPVVWPEGPQEHDEVQAIRDRP